VYAEKKQQAKVSTKNLTNSLKNQSELFVLPLNAV